VAEAPPPPKFVFRTIGDLAERCGQYCWIENRLFALTGMWASAPGAAGAAGAAGALEAEIRVACSAMSSWHGFVAGQWWDRLPVRAGVDPAALVVPPPGPFGPVFELLEADADLRGALGGLAEQILPALLGVYDEHLAGASPVSEAPVRALLGLIRPQLILEIERGREVLRQGPGAAAEADGGVEKRAEMAARLQRVLGAEKAIFPAARAS
jgi:hypothetical protein